MVYIYTEFVYLTVCQNPFAHALLKFGLPGNLPGIFRKSSGNTVFFAVALLGHLLARWRGIFFPAPAHVHKPPLARHRRNRNSQQKRPRARIIPGVVTQPGQASPHCCIHSISALKHVPQLQICYTQRNVLHEVEPKKERVGAQVRPFFVHRVALPPR